MLLNTYIALSAVAEVPHTNSEIAVYGLKMAVYGMGIVFLILILLWGMLSAFRFFFYDLPRKKSNVRKEASTAFVTFSGKIPEYSDNLELIAAITAAVSAFRQGNNESGLFRVVSFKKRK